MRHSFAKWTWAHRATAALFLLLLVRGGQGAWGWFEGAAPATRFFGWLRFVDPLAALESALAHGTLNQSMLIGAALLVLAAALMGPIFCGWLCPLGLLLDLNGALRRVFSGRSGRLRQVPHVSGQPRLIPLGFVLAFSAVAHVPVFTTFSPIQMVVAAVSTGSLVAFVVLGLLALVEWFSPRLWCRRLCPLGGLYAILGRFAWLRIRINRKRAGQSPCRQCTTHCPMGIPVMEAHVLKKGAAIFDPNCTRCGTCLDVCRNDVLSCGLPGGIRGHHAQPDTVEKP